MNDERQPSTRVVNVEALKSLQDEFKAFEFLAAIEGLDELCANWEGEDGFRSLLLALHGMAKGIIDDEDYSLLSSEPPVWELATNIDLQVFEYSEQLKTVASALDLFADLIPDGEEDDDE